MSEKAIVLLSTDIGTDIDDAVALCLAMNSDAIDLTGVYVTNGPVAHRARIARHMLGLGGHDALVAVGEETAMHTEFNAYTTGAEPYLAPRKGIVGPPIIMDWLSAMERQLGASGQAVVASIAPLTNIAKLLEKKPEAAAWIKTLYVMGGRLKEREHNFSHDSLAAQRVLASGLDTVIVPADVCSRYLLDVNFILGLEGSRLQRYLARMAALWKLFKDSSTALNSELERELERPILPGDWGEKPTQEDLERFGRFQMHLQLLCNMHNLIDMPQYQLESYESMVKWAKANRRLWYAKRFLDWLDEKGMKGILVSDAFVIYAIENPDKVREERVNVSCDEKGIMTIEKGGRHRLVTRVDYDHFDSYLKSRLKAVPEPRVAYPGKLRK